MAEWIKKVKAFQFKGILVILGCFLLIGAILFAERSGLSYREKAKKLTYLDADKVVTEETAIKTLKPTCLVLTDSSQANSTMAWIQFEQIFKDMKVGTDLVRNTHRISESKDVHAVSCRICTSLGTGVCPAHTFSAFFRYGSGENSGS